MTLSISVSTSSKLSSPMHNHFVVATGELARLPNAFSQNVWSPILWKGGTRLRQNFLSASLIVLDFDSGEWGLEDAREWMHELNLAGFVSPTKSHMVPKKIGSMTLALPRFRVIIPASSPCTSLDDYEHTMRELSATVPCDKSCKDGARFFFPSQPVAAEPGTNPLRWLSCPADETLAIRQARKIAEIPPEAMRRKDMLPTYVVRWLRVGADVGERHKTAYMLGLELRLRGFTTDESFGLALTLGGNLPSIGERELRRAIANGAAKAEELGATTTTTNA